MDKIMKNNRVSVEKLPKIYFDTFYVRGPLVVQQAVGGGFRARRNGNPRFPVKRWSRHDITVNDAPWTK